MSRSEEPVTEALYRRYRPDTFEDMVGQNHVTDTLQRALSNGRASHAYLFSGPRGCGKTTSARILARCLNCAEGPTDTPCGKCPSCLDLAVGGPGSLDVVEIDAASNRGVDDARELRERAAFAPARDRYKVFVLDEAHMVTREGFNALLKIVEEPPPHVKFIFATTEPEKVIGTIKSRTHHYHFRLVPPEVLVPYLENICEREGISPEPGVLDLVVRAGGGSVRDSMSVLDQLLAGSHDEVIEYAPSVALLGYTDANLLDNMIDALAEADGGKVFDLIEQVVASGHDPRRFADDLLQRVRDLVICALAPGQAGDIMPHLPADQLERMLSQANAAGSRVLSRQADMIEEALRTMVGATSPRLQLELLAARLLADKEEAPAAAPAPVPSSSPSPRETAPVRERRPSESPRAGRSEAPTEAARSAPAPAQGPSTAPAGAPAQPEPAPAPARKSSPPAATTPTEGDVPWEDIVARVNETSRVSGAIVRNAKARALPGKIVALLAPPHMVARVEAQLGAVQNAVDTVMGPGWSVQLDDGKAPDPKVMPAEPAPEPTKPAARVTPTPRPVAQTTPAPEPEWTPGPEPEPEYEPAPAPVPEPDSVPDPVPDFGDDDQGDASLDDETITNPTRSAEELVLEILGGRVIEGEGSGF